MIVISKNKNKLIVGAYMAMFFAIFFIFCQKNVLAVEYEENFDSCTNGQEWETCNANVSDDPTYPGNNILISNALSSSNPNSLKTPASGVEFDIWNIGEDIDYLDLSFLSSVSADNIYAVILGASSSNWQIKAILKGSNVCVLQTSEGASVNFGPNPCHAGNTWTNLNIIASSTIGYYQACINNLNCSTWLYATTTVQSMMIGGANTGTSWYFDDIIINNDSYYPTDTEFTSVSPVFASTIYPNLLYPWATYTIIFSSDDVGLYENVRVQVWNESSTTDLVYYEDYDPFDIWYGSAYSVDIYEYPDFGFDIDIGYSLNQAIFQLWGYNGISAPVLITSTSSYYYVGTTTEDELFAENLADLMANLCDDNPCLGVSSTTDAWYEIADDIYCGLRLTSNWLICPSEDSVKRVYSRINSLKTKFPASIYYEIKSIYDDVSTSSSQTLYFPSITITTAGSPDTNLPLIASNTIETLRASNTYVDTVYTFLEYMPFGILILYIINYLFFKAESI